MDSNHDIASLPPLRAEFAGGTFRGITTRKDGIHCAVILLPNKATEKRNWEGCVDWAREAGGELPTRSVFHLLRLSDTKEELAEGGWYYTADLLSDDTGDEDDAAYAWICSFNGGCSYRYHKSYEGLAVAVRLIPLTSPAKVGGDEREAFNTEYDKIANRPISIREIAWRMWKARAALTSPEKLGGDDLDTLLGKYWELAYDEGKNGVSHGDAANLVLHQLREVARVAKVGGDEWRAEADRLIMNLCDTTYTWARGPKYYHQELANRTAANSACDALKAHLRAALTSPATVGVSTSQAIAAVREDISQMSAEELRAEFDQHAPATVGGDEREGYIASLPADWHKDSSLETWFPLTAEELAATKRMFGEACADLGRVNEALGLDPDDAGAEPILDAIEELKARAALSADGGEDSGRFPALTELLAAHASELESNAYAYFELTYTRHTEWMAWICSNSRESDPGRKVIAHGQGATPEEACRAAIAANQARPQTK